MDYTNLRTGFWHTSTHSTRSTVSTLDMVGEEARNRILQSRLDGTLVAYPRATGGSPSRTPQAKGQAQHGRSWCRAAHVEAFHHQVLLNGLRRGKRSRHHGHHMLVGLGQRGLPREDGAQVGAGGLGWWQGHLALCVTRGQRGGGVGVRMGHGLRT